MSGRGCADVPLMYPGILDGREQIESTNCGHSLVSVLIQKGIPVVDVALDGTHRESASAPRRIRVTLAPVETTAAVRSWRLPRHRRRPRSRVESGRAIGSGCGSGSHDSSCHWTGASMRAYTPPGGDPTRLLQQRVLFRDAAPAISIHAKGKAWLGSVTCDVAPARQCLQRGTSSQVTVGWPSSSALGVAGR